MKEFKIRAAVPQCRPVLQQFLNETISPMLPMSAVSLKGRAMDEHPGPSAFRPP